MQHTHTQDTDTLNVIAQCCLLTPPFHLRPISSVMMTHVCVVSGRRAALECINQELLYKRRGAHASLHGETNMRINDTYLFCGATRRSFHPSPVSRLQLFFFPCFSPLLLRVNGPTK